MKRKRILIWIMCLSAALLLTACGSSTGSGPDVTDVHTVRETLSLDSVPVTWNLLAQLLIRVGKSPTA